jgi:acyl transferase domain-containing protein
MKNLFSLSAARLRDASAEFSIGVRSVPILKDHGFRDMVALPGSLYINVALSLDRKLSARGPRVVRKVAFAKPVILSAEDTVMKLDVTDRGKSRVEYTFYEAVVEGGNVGGTRRYAASLQIDSNVTVPPKVKSSRFSIDTFQARSSSVIDSDQFYKKLRENGNQYGPGFQRVSSIWRRGTQSLGKLSAARHTRETGPQNLDPSLLDAMTQLLAPFIMEKRKTFVLQSIDKLEFADRHFPDTLWAHAVLLKAKASDENSFLGKVRVFDQSGNTYVKLSKVAFTLLDSSEHRMKSQPQRPSSPPNFPPEPIRPTLG